VATKQCDQFSSSPTQKKRCLHKTAQTWLLERGKEYEHIPSSYITGNDLARTFIEKTQGAVRVADLSNWTLVGTTPQGVRVSIDAESIKPAPNDFVFVWVEQASDKEIRYREYSYYTARSRYVIDCVNVKTKSTSLIFFAKNGTPVFTLADESFRPAIPDTGDYAIVAKVCQLAGNAIAESKGIGR
jgi:hypothetical protein